MMPPAVEGGVLDEAEVAALRTALLDEYAAEAYYRAVMDTFGSSRRFENLMAAEGRHAGALVSLFERYGLEPPSQAEAVVPEVPPTLGEAIRLALENEQANVAMYDELLETLTADDVSFVLQRLREASAERHVPSLTRALP